MGRHREWFRQYFDVDYVTALQAEKPSRQTRLEVDFVLRALDVAEGSRILDVPCGYGRHTRELARRGFRVVGVDLSHPMIAEARRCAREGARLQFRRLDMRQIAFCEEFDAVVNLYTSFGYFTPAQNRAVLARMARALRPGGRILIDHRDPAHDAALPRRLWYRTGPKRFVLEDRRFDRRTKITDSTQLIVTVGARWVVQKHLRLQEFSLGEWRRMLRGVGLRLLRAYSAYDGRRYRTGSTGRLIVVAQRSRRRQSRKRDSA
jgi:SAM-dependent methyltransferase